MSLQIPHFLRSRSRSRSRSNSDVSTISQSSSSSAIKIKLVLPPCSADRYIEAVEKELYQPVPVEGDPGQQAMLELVKERHSETIKLAKSRLQHIRNVLGEVVKCCRGTNEEKAQVERQSRFLMIASDGRDPLLNYLYDSSYQLIKDTAEEMLSYASGDDRSRGARSASSLAKKFSDEKLQDHLKFLAKPGTARSGILMSDISKIRDRAERVPGEDASKVSEWRSIINSLIHERVNTHILRERISFERARDLLFVILRYQQPLTVNGEIASKFEPGALLENWCEPDQIEPPLYSAEPSQRQASRVANFALAPPPGDSALVHRLVLAQDEYLSTANQQLPPHYSAHSLLHARRRMSSRQIGIYGL